MPYVFNPFTGNFDIVDTNTAAGSDTQVQFNDGGTLAGDTALTWNKTSDQLTISGDVNLDSGGSFSTTIQSVTPTANRTISFPDKTGTVGLVAGATGNIQYNNAGALAGSADLNVELDWSSSTTVYTGLKLNATDTLSAPGSKLVDLQINGTTIGLVDSTGARFTRTADATTGGNLFVERLNNHSGFYLFPNNTNNGVGAAPQGFFAGGNAIYGWTAGAVTTSLPTPDTGLSREAAGIVKITAGFSGTGYLKQTPVAIQNLPTPSATYEGAKGFVTDASVSTFYSVVAVGNNDGGSIKVPVFCDGTNWRIG